MQFELFVSLQLEVAHHFIESRAGERSRRLEPPTTFGATKTPKTLLVNPYQVPGHGTKRSPFVAVSLPDYRRRPSPRVSVAEDA
jgi:hypothetical protein